MEKMPDNFSGFTQIEYLTVFITIIFGIIATEFFTGWGNLLRNRPLTKIYPLHLAWTIFIFITFIQNWFGVWPRIKFINYNFLYFFYALIPLLTYHFMTITLFPKVRVGRRVNLKIFYFRNARTFYILFAVYLSTAILNSYIYQDVGNILLQNIIRLGGLLFALSCAYFKRSFWLHLAFLVTGYAGIFQFILAIPR